MNKNFHEAYDNIQKFKGGRSIAFDEVLQRTLKVVAEMAVDKSKKYISKKEELRKANELLEQIKNLKSSDLEESTKEPPFPISQDLSIPYQNFDHSYQKYLSHVKYLKSTIFVSNAPFTNESALLVIDMQRDFVPDALIGKKLSGFGVEHGIYVVNPIKDLISKVLYHRDKSIDVIMSRDYHPNDHKSFKQNGGVFPAHCIQGTPGAEFVKPIAELLNRYLNDTAPKLHDIQGSDQEKITKKKTIRG